jgi:hypothetical protein
VLRPVSLGRELNGGGAELEARRVLSGGSSATSRKTVKFSFYSKIFKMIRIDLIKNGRLEKFQIKYQFESFKIWNNFSYLNFFKFGIEFELKIRKGSRI